MLVETVKLCSGRVDWGAAATGKSASRAPKGVARGAGVRVSMYPHVSSFLLQSDKARWTSAGDSEVSH
jgi:hypothetical protein